MIKLFMCNLKVLLGQQVIRNLLAVGCLVYSVLISLLGNYHDGHLMELMSLLFCAGSRKNNQSNTSVLMRSLRWYLLRVFKSYCLEKKLSLQKAML